MNKAGRPQAHITVDRKYEIKSIQGRQHTVVRYLAMGTLTQRQIAEIVGMTPTEISNIANSAIVRKQLALMHGTMGKAAMDTSRYIEEVVVPKATKLLERIIDDEDEDGEMLLNNSLRLRADVAKTMLSRGGYGETSKVESRGVIAVVDGAAIEDIKQRAAERKAKEIEMEVTDVTEGSR